MIIELPFITGDVVTYGEESFRWLVVDFTFTQTSHWVERRVAGGNSAYQVVTEIYPPDKSWTLIPEISMGGRATQLTISESTPGFELWQKVTRHEDDSPDNRA